MITKQRGGRDVVSDVTFRREPGTITGFLGPSPTAARPASSAGRRSPGDGPYGNSVINLELATAA